VNRGADYGRDWVIKKEVIKERRAMEILKKYYLLFCLLFLFIGLALEYTSSQVKLEYSQLSRIQAGKIVTDNVYKYSDSLPFLRAFSAFMFTLAASVFVSVFVTNRIESTQRKRQEAELNSIRECINKDVFDGVFKSLLPHEIYEVIKSDIIQTDLVRRKVVWIYDFTETGEGSVNLKQTLKSELHNESQDTYEKGYRVSFNTSEDATTVLKSVTCEYKGTKIASLDRDNPNENDNLACPNEIENSFNIPLSINTHDYVDLTTIFQTVYQSGLVADSYFTVHPLIDITLIVRHPSGWEFSVFDNFSSKLRYISGDFTGCIYELRGAVLPKQGMTFYLKRVRETTPEEERQAVPEVGDTQPCLSPDG